MTLPLVFAGSSSVRAARVENAWDGKTLDGWEHVGPGRMVLEDGLMRTEGGMGLLWYTREKLGNCIDPDRLQDDEREESNPGVFIRVADKPKDEWYAVHHGYEVQICDGLTRFIAQGPFIRCRRRRPRPSKVGEWNTMEIRLDGRARPGHAQWRRFKDFDPSTAKIPDRTKDYEPEAGGPWPELGYFLAFRTTTTSPKGRRSISRSVSVGPLDRLTCVGSTIKARGDSPRDGRRRRVGA